MTFVKVLREQQGTIIHKLPLIFPTLQSLQTPEANEGTEEKDFLLNSPLAALPVIFAKTSTFLNPVIYVGMNSQVSFKFKVYGIRHRS